MFPPMWIQLAVHEHRREDALDQGTWCTSDRRLDAGAVQGARVVAVVEDVVRRAEVPATSQIQTSDVDSDQRDRDDGERPRRDVVLDREHCADAKG